MNEEISKSLSGTEVLNLLDNKCNLVQYSDVHNIKSIDELLGPHKKCVMLYHTSTNYGHWCCIYEYNDITLGKTTIFFLILMGQSRTPNLNFYQEILNKN